MSSREKRKQKQLKPYKMNVDYSLLDEAMSKMGATLDTRPLPKPKPRKENLSERIERITYEHGEAGMKKPAHYDNPNIVDDENWRQRPRPFDSQECQDHLLALLQLCHPHPSSGRCERKSIYCVCPLK